MSIKSLAALGAARNVRPPTKSDAGESTEESADKGQPASLGQLLVKQVPTGMVAAYTALTAALVELVDEPTSSDPNPDQLLPFRWAALGILVVVSMVLVYVSYRGEVSGKVRRPVAELLGVGIAAAGWGLVLPESPLLAQWTGDSGVAMVLLIAFAATAANLVVAIRLKSKAPARSA